LRTLTRGSSDDEAAAAAIADAIAVLAREEDGVAAIVVGLPKRLDGSETDLTTHVRRMVDRLRPLVRIPIELQDERLSSQEAESRLALRERDWRARKARLDAASAAVILQDYLDSRATAPPSISPASIQD
jgi:putative Holliday junction resolvase